jgi:hypothetical protein
MAPGTALIAPGATLKFSMDKSRLDPRLRLVSARGTPSRLHVVDPRQPEHASRDVPPV